MTAKQLDEMIDEIRDLTRRLIEFPNKWDKILNETSPEEVAKLASLQKRAEYYAAVCALDAAYEYFADKQDDNEEQKRLLT